MTVCVTVNGLGRIRCDMVHVLYGSGRRTEITVVAINEPADAAGMAHLLEYDTSHGRLAWEVRQGRSQLSVGDDAVRVLHEHLLQLFPWYELSVDVVLDCTGTHGSHEHDEAHTAAGTKEILFSRPGSNNLGTVIVYGINQNQLRMERRIVSNASCATNCIVPVVKLSDNVYGIEPDTVTTTRSTMHSQQVVSAYHLDLHRTRAANRSVISVDIKLAAGITRFFPRFNSRSEAIAVHVPTINVTTIDLGVAVRKLIKADEVSLLLQKAVQGTFHDIVDYTELPLASVDFNRDPHSAIVDGTQVRIGGAHLIKALVWCGNRQDFANRMLDTTLAMTTVAFR